MLRACRWVTTPLSMFRNLSLQKAIACLVSCQTLPVLRQLIWLRTFSKRSMSQRLAPWHSFGESEEHRTSYLAQGNHGKTEPAVSSFLNFFPSWIFFVVCDCDVCEPNTTMHDYAMHAARFLALRHKTPTNRPLPRSNLDLIAEVNGKPLSHKHRQACLFLVPVYFLDTLWHVIIMWFYNSSCVVFPSSPTVTCSYNSP